MFYFQFDIDAWRRATRGESPAAKGVYLELMLEYYAKESALPNDEDGLSRIVGVITKEERKALRHVLGKFFDKCGEVIKNPRCEDELTAYRELKTKNQLNGKKSKGRPKTQPEPTNNPVGYSLVSNMSENETHTEPRYKPTDNPTQEPTHPIPIPPENNTPLYPGGIGKILGQGSGRGRAGRLPPASEVRGVFETIDAELLRAMPGAAIQRACVFVGLNPRTAAKAANRKDLTVDGFMREYESILTDERLENPLGILASRLQLSHPSRGGK